MLELKNIKKSFNPTGNPEDEIVALKDLSLTIEDGEFVTVIGTNGSGKSTTMNILTGLYFPDEGEIILNGQNITKMKEHKRARFFGRVFQDPMMGTAANMSVIENLEIAYRRGKVHSPIAWGFKKSNKELFINELQRFDLGIENKLNKKVGLMSGGQRQALTLLMASLQKPDILLLDEHTAALDPKTARKVLELTEKIVNENKMTTIMITHNMSDALKYGNRLIMFADGGIKLDIKGEDKAKLKIEDLLKLFNELDSENNDKTHVN
ncbi:MAG: ATP-binding cassette domain-containing protein [Bacilli bacterium]|nr:ATP-binding cassette domain-containing protein [Bacilli bacterium]